MTPEEAAAEFDVEFFVTPVAAWSTLDLHLPDPDNPEQTRCERIADDRPTRPIAPDRAGHRELCRLCTGEAETADSSGPRLSAKLAKLDPDAVSTDGGGRRAE